MLTHKLSPFLSFLLAEISIRQQIWTAQLCFVEEEKEKKHEREEATWQEVAHPHTATSTCLDVFSAVH